MKIIVHTNAPWAGTGYGSQCALFAPQFRDAGHDVAISAFWGLNGKALEWEGMKVYPGDETWGNKWLPAYAAHHGKGDTASVQVITLMDVWVLVSKLFGQLNMASWCPVDHQPVPPRVREFFEMSKAAPIAMSRFGFDEMVKSGLEPYYVPHGVDTDVLRPIPKAEVRAAMGIPEDAFVVGMVAANKGNAPPRKAFPQVFEAFARFQKKHSDALLYIHSVQEGGQTGLDLMVLAKVCGVPLEAIRWTPEFELQMGVEYEKMAWVYSNMDVLASPSYGEGFGIPIVEAQACGVPVVVNDFSAMPELLGAGWKVGGERWYDMSQGSWFQSPNTDQIVDALEAAYDGAAGLGDKAREFALGYDAKKVMADHWTPVLAALAERMLGRLEMPVVALNRAARRRAPKRKVA